MRKLYIFTILTFLAGLIPPNLSLAAETGLYADAVYSASNQVYQPSNSLGAPDGIYTDFFAKNATFTLDLGENENGTGDLTFYFKVLNYGAGYNIDFLDAGFIKVQTTGNILPLSTTELTIAYVGGVPYRYVTITSLYDEQWQIDAVMTASIYETVEVEEAEETTPTEETKTPPIDTINETETCGGNQGLIVKRPDDGSLQTNADSIVYTIGCDNTLHVFPDEQTFKTWWTDFDDLAFVNSGFLTTHEEGAKVTIRPGTYLVKLPSDPKVYAVEPGGILRWLPDETTAETLYGVGWNTRIIDLSESLFSDYSIGDDLTAEFYPDGTIGYLSTGQVVYLEDDTYHAFIGELWSTGRFQSKFLVDLDDTITANYFAGDEWNENSEILFPF